MRLKMIRTVALVLAMATVSCSGKASGGSLSASAKPDSSSEAGPTKAKKGALITEAKLQIAAIARSAVAAYERESMSEAKPGEEPTFTHQLCKTATPIGDKVPENGATFDVTEKDFESAPDTGWKCLKFSLSKKSSFQYTYTLGSTPKQAARGSDVGNGDGNAFEICAEADFIAGGKTTLLCQSGTIIPDSKQVRLNSQLYIADEGE